MTTFMNVEEAVNVAYVDFTKEFSAVSCHTQNDEVWARYADSEVGKKQSDLLHSQALISGVVHSRG